MSKKDTIEMFKMTSYDPVQQIAGFTYISESNQVKTILLSQMIFKAIMSDQPWDQKRYGQMHSTQFEFRTCLRNYGKDISNWDAWFSTASNNLIKESASIRSRKLND